jgi:hypothetical protein
MRELTLAAVLAALPASTAAAPPAAVGSRIEHPALRSRHTQGVELLTSAQLADDLESTALNLRDLAYFRYRAWDGTLPEREKQWAFQRMLEESREQRLLDRYAAAGLPAGAVLEGPPSEQSWHMPFPADQEGAEWEQSRRLSNEGLALARRVRAEAAAQVLARARDEADR